MEASSIRQRVLEAFTPFSRSLTATFLEVEPMIAERYSSDGYTVWVETAIRIATASFRSWEAAIEFLRASGSLAATLSETEFAAWAEAGDRLAAKSAIVAAAYFASSPAARIKLAPDELPAWGALGERLHGESWKAISLAVRFFEQSPTLLRDLSTPELSAFAAFLAALAVRSYEAAAETLEHGRAVLVALPPADRPRLLRLVERIAPTSWRTAQSLFRDAPSAMRDLDPAVRSAVLALADRLAQQRPDETLGFLKDCVAALAKIPAAKRGEYLDLAKPLAARSWRAVTAFLGSATHVEQQAGAAGLRAWHSLGREALEDNEDAGVAFFQLQSTRARQALEAVSPGVTLAAVADILRVYGAALTGRDIRIASTADLTTRAVGWTQVERPATDGVAVHVPPYLDRYGDKDANFAAYKVLVTHQTSHLEFGTFAFRFDRPAAVHASNERDSLPFDPTLGQFEQLFDAFPERKLAKDLFTVVEDFRIDCRIRHEYPGIRRALAVVQAHALQTRPRRPLPMQELLVEYLIRLSLAFEERRSQPAMAPLAEFLVPLTDPNATVEDSAEAAIRLYRFITAIPNVPTTPTTAADEVDDPGEDVAIAGVETGGDATRAGVAYQSPAPVDYRDDFKPEVVEAMARLHADETGDRDTASGLSPHDLQRLLEKSGELELHGLDTGDIARSSGLFVNNMLREAGKPPTHLGQTAPEFARPTTTPTPSRHPLSATEPTCTVYDEWDFRAGDYRPHWCRVKEQVLVEGTTEFFEATLSANRALVADIRRQFEMLRPEAFKKIKRLKDGDEFDLDATIEAVLDRKARKTPSDKIYWRRNKMERDVAVVFLLDMSASTDEEIEERPRATSAPDPIQSFRYDKAGFWRWHWDEPLEPPRKRIIDVEKESVVLLIKALETIGDTYGIYGFSGYGRDNVEFFVIKDLREALSDRVKRRVERIAPVQGTRMGPAIRHAVTKLSDVDTRMKLLILLSDGRPQDHNYGKDRTEKEYAIHDTRMALLEAKRRQITPFCLTVDRFGHDYLKQMCGDIGYEIVSDISMLPKRLPTLYRRLTT